MRFIILQKNHAHYQINQLFFFKPVVKNTRNPDVSIAWVHLHKPWHSRQKALNLSLTCPQ